VGFSGAWKATAAARAADGGAAPLGHPEYSALHATVDYDPPGSRPPYAAERMQQVPSTITDDMQGYDLVRTNQAPGLLVDHTPVDHSTGMPTPDGGGRSYSGARSSANRARSADLGSALQRLRRPLELDEGAHTGDRLEIQPVNGGSRTSPYLGKMGTPESNPEGDGAGGPVRNGFRIQRWYERQIPMHYRRHDLRAQRTQLAAAATSSPSTTGNRYSSPYGWLQSGRTRTNSAPLQRRVPRPWDEDVTTDGTDTSSPLSPAWGL